MLRPWLAALTLLCLTLLGAFAAATPNDFHFVILGDRTGRAQPGIYGRVWREIALLSPDFVINVGDTIEGGNDERAPAEWAAVQAVWKRHGTLPLYLVPGNHDIFSDRSRRLFEKISGRPAAYSFDIQNAHFTVLDNSQTDELSPQQLAFLQQDLERHKTRDPKFVFFHKPYWVIPVPLGTDFPLHQLARQYGVDYIVSGHAHKLMRLTRDGIVYLSVGSSGADMSRGLSRGEGFAQGWFYHYAWARVKGATVSVAIKELDGPAGKGRFFPADDWGIAGPVFEQNDPAAVGKPES